MIYSNTHLSEASNIIKKIDIKKIENMVDIILNVRKQMNMSKYKLNKR